MRVLIAGGGTGGLAAAIALRKAGLEPLVLEQAPAFTAIGAGLGLYVNAMKALSYLGADTHWRATAARIDIAGQRGLGDDQLIAESSLEPRAAKYGEPYFCGHRADLLTSLLLALPPECVRVASRVVGYEETGDDVRVELATGEEVHGDLLVGADGLRSATRRLLMGEREARFTGVVVWRGLIPREKVPARYDAKIMSWYGPQRHVLLYPLRHDRHPDSVYSLSAFVPATEVHRESWTASGDLADLHASLAGACPALQDLLAVMDGALITGIYFRDPLETWGSDRVVLLGDAAHPAPPSAGQGAGMALEDAVMLAACLERAGTDVRAALREYEFRRKARTTRMLESARVNLANSQTHDPVQVRARNGYLRGLERLSPAGPPMQEWLLAHDPVAAARQSPAEFERTLAVPGNPMRRPEARRAFDLWRGALTGEHRAAGWLGERRGYAEFVSGRLHPEGGNPPASRVDCDGVPAMLVGRPSPAPSPDSRAPVVLHLHGGGYTLGSAELSVPLAGRLAEAAGGWSLIPDYRLAPEHPFPAALHDALAAYRWLARRYPQAPVIVSGECAGGGLALSLALALRDADTGPQGPATRMPAGIHVVSPLCDLALPADHRGLAADSDPWLSRIALIQLAACYVQDTDPGQPLVSPVRADLSGLPPLLIQAAEPEALFPSAQRLADRARDAGVPVTFRPVADSVHSFILFGFLPEAGNALAEFGTFTRNTLNPQRDLNNSLARNTEPLPQCDPSCAAVSRTSADPPARRGSRCMTTQPESGPPSGAGNAGGNSGRGSRPGYGPARRPGPMMGAAIAAAVAVAVLGLSATAVALTGHFGPKSSGSGQGASPGSASSSTTAGSSTVNTIEPAGGKAAFTADATVTPAATTSTCAAPVAFTVAGTISAAAAGTVKYQWTGSSGITGQVQTLHFSGPGTQRVTGTTARSKTAGTGWAAIKILSPKAATSNRATYILDCSTSPVTVSATATATPASSKISCAAAPPSATFTGTIRDAKAGTVTYYWELPTGNGPTRSLTFTAPGTQPAAPATVTAASDSSTGSGTLIVLSPAAVSSNTATFSVSCTQPAPTGSSAPATAPASTLPTDVTVDLIANQPTPKTVACGSTPPAFEVMATFTSTGTTLTETYHWVRPDGITTAPGKINVNAGSTTSTSDQFTPSSDNFSGSETLVFTSPVQGSWSIPLALNCSSTTPSASPSSNPATAPATPPAAIVEPKTGDVESGAVGQPFSMTITAAHGAPPYIWSINGLPPGLAVNAAGDAISGTPTAGGVYNLTLYLGDSVTPPGEQAWVKFTLNISWPPLVASVPSLPDGTVGVPYPSVTFSATGGTGTYSWFVDATTISAGLDLSTSGVLSGTPTVAGTFNVSIRVLDHSGLSETVTRTLVINPA